jgi:hypothetical protein
MSDRDSISKSLEAVTRALARRPDDDDQRASTFARGLALGALVGAAIAGSTIWQRRHARMAMLPVEPADATGEDAATPG